METKVIKGNWTALTPIHHGGSDDYGTTKLILTLPCIVGDEIIEVPTIHGNAIRGYLRRLIMQDFLDNLDYKLNSKKLYHFLMTGGMLEANKKDTGAINLTLKKDLRENIPPISLFGSALGNQMLQGKMKVGIGELVCKELKDNYEISAYNLKSTDFGTRLDDLREAAEDDEPAHQMKYEFETIIKGSKFMHEFVLEDCNEVEKSCFARMFHLWEERPYVGGKSNVGYGKIRLNYTAMSEYSEDTYLQYLQDNKKDIVGFLDGLCQEWK